MAPSPGWERWRCHAAILVLALVSSLPAAAAPVAPAWPLRAGPHGRYLEDQNGVPFLIAADTGWCMVNGLTDTEIDTYLQTRKAQGFNAIQFMLMSKHSGCSVGGTSIDRYGHSPFTTGDDDWSVPDDAYWRRVDLILNKIKSLDMLALVTPAYLGFDCYNDTQGWCGVMNAQSPARMGSFGKFLGTRYRAQGNLIWIAGGDANPLDYPGMDAREDALMSAIATYDTSHQLITGHAGRHVSAAQAFGAHPWLTMNSAYDGESCPDDSMALQIETEYARTPPMPLHSIEQKYDEEGADAVCLADQFLWIALGGGVGQSYGNGEVWNFAAGWDGAETGVHSPLARVHTNSAKLVRSRKFWLFTPDTTHSVVVSGYGSGTTTVAAARASTGETVMAYVPVEGTTITVDMTKISGGHANAYWFDPITGTPSLIGTFPTTGTQDFTSPGAARVLILDDATLAFPPPGARDAVYAPPKPVTAGPRIPSRRPQHRSDPAHP